MHAAATRRCGQPFLAAKGWDEDPQIAKRSHRAHRGGFGALLCESVSRVSGRYQALPDSARSGASAHIARDLAAACSGSPSESPLASVRMKRRSLLTPLRAGFYTLWLVSLDGSRSLTDEGMAQP